MKPQIPNVKRFADLPAPGWMAVCRGSALGLCLLLCMNLAEVFAHSTNSADNWFCRLQPVPGQVATGLLAMTATCLLLFSLRPCLPSPVWFCAGLMVLFMIGGCGREIWEIQGAVFGDDRVTAMLKPLGITMLFLVAGIGILTGTSSSVQGRSSVVSILISAVLSVVGFAVVMVQSGSISDSLPDAVSDVVLVAGLPPSSDGSVSEELMDRIRTAGRLVVDRHARSLFISAGRDASPEQQSAISAVAVEAGVDVSRVKVVSESTDITTTVQSYISQAGTPKRKEAMIVSHWFELARCRVLARRQGLSVTVMAAEQEHALFQQNVRVAREVLELLQQLAQPAVQLVQGAMASDKTNVDEQGSSSSEDGEMDLDDQLEDLKSMEL
ncbi:MAG: YdcF family protein [Planctomycetota bacterium]